MNATLPTKSNVYNGKNYSNTKEMIAALSVVGTGSDGQLVECVTVRVYMGRSRSASVVYATVWLRGTVHGSGSGSAGGGGYCKQSAAIASAISSCGVTLSEEVAGCGMSRAQDALLAIAEAMGYTGCIVISHS